MLLALACGVVLRALQQNNWWPHSPRPDKRSFISWVVPRIYLDQWQDVIKRLPEHAVFHSDFLLTEHEYHPYTLKNLAHLQQDHKMLFAVDIKGVTPKDYEKNTRKPFKHRLFWDNLRALVEHGINFYITFTNPDPEALPAFQHRLKYLFGGQILDDSFVIPLIEYDAAPFVDILPARA